MQIVVKMDLELVPPQLTLSSLLFIEFDSWFVESLSNQNNCNKTIGRDVPNPVGAYITSMESAPYSAKHLMVGK